MMLPPDWRLTGTLVIVNILELCIRCYQLGSVDDAATGLETDWYTCDCEYTRAMYQVLLVSQVVIVNILELSVDDAATGLETDWYTCDCEYTRAMYQVLLVRVSR